MKVEFRGTPVDFRSGVFSDFTNKKPVGNMSQVSSVIAKTESDKVTFSTKKKTIVGVVLAAIAGGAIWLVNLLRGRGKVTPKPVIDAGNQIAEPVVNTVKIAFQKTMEKFPEDLAYIKNLAKNLGLKEGEEFKLNSVVGKSQLKALLDDFTPQDFTIGKNFEGAKNSTFRVNLHNHTQFSDGKLSVADFLEQARKYADKVAKNKTDNKPPFTISITDHDTLDGCREALKILSENPEKFKNLKVVLGSEISVSNCDKNIVSRPLNFELVGYSQNPYDEKLVKLLANIQKTRSENVEKFLEKINEKFEGYNLNLVEAKTFHANLKNMRTNGVLYLAGDYAKFKILLSEYVKKANEILPKNNQLSAENLFEKFGDNFYYRMDAFGERDMKNYFKNHGLHDYLKEKGFLTKENEKSLEKIFEVDTKDKEDFISKIVQESLPNIDDRKQYSLDPTSVFEATTEGFYGFAHPGIIDFASDNISLARKKLCEQNCYAPHENLVYEIFNSLKQKGGEKFLASEVNYQSYPTYTGKEWRDFMKNIADNENLKLKYTGGIDAHKPSIFVKHKYLDEKLLQELLGE